MRLFIGIDLDDSLKQSIREFQSELKKNGIAGSWKAIENFHLTLEFLGEIDPNRVPVLINILPQGVKNAKPFQLRIEGLGAFPNMRRPHTLWTGVGGSIKELHQLKNDLHHELIRNGFALENRAFKPHITLASRPQLNDIDLSGFRTKELGRLTVTEVILFESRVLGGKRVYTDLYRSILQKWS